MFTTVVCKAQANNLSQQQVRSLTTLGELWGFLKYYHPQVAKGRCDWDSVLIAKIPLFLIAKDKTAISNLSASWLKELGPVDSCKSCYRMVPDSLSYNLDLSWINERTFTPGVVSQLTFIRDNRNIGSHYYVEYDKSNGYLVNFIHEKPYNDPKYYYPGVEYRLLLLFRYWNIVNYFSPYKHLSGKDWKKVLEEKIPAFYSASDALTYQLEYVKLVNSLNDGHSIVHGMVMDAFIGQFYRVPFSCMLIDQQFVVSSIINDSAASMLKIKQGDIIEEVNGEDVAERYKRLKPYIIASNEDNRAMIFASSFLFRGRTVFSILKKGEEENFIMTP